MSNQDSLILDANDLTHEQVERITTWANNRVNHETKAKLIELKGKLPEPSKRNTEFDGGYDKALEHTHTLIDKAIKESQDEA